MAGLPAAAGAALPGEGAAGPDSPRIHHVNVGDSLAQAVAAAGEGDIVELQAGVHRGQTAVINQQRLTLRASGDRAVLLADGAHAEGKAAIVVRGGQVQVQGLSFRGNRVPDGNGAGIRFERGRLTVRDCEFVDNEMGILTSDAPEADLQLEHCSFSQAPPHDGLLHHLVYVGRIGRFTLVGSRLGGGWRGHLVKSRARHSVVTCNWLDDGADGAASYELEFPNGGEAWVRGNVIVQSPRTENLALVAYGADRWQHPRGLLVLAHNTLVNRADRPALFVRSWPQHLPPGSELHALHNLFVGSGVTFTAATQQAGNARLALDAFDRDERPPSSLTPPPAVRGRDLTPREQIAFPLGLRALAPRHHWRPGALQD